MSLATCPSCDGLVPATRRACPHCDRPVRRGVARALAAGAALMTLMACYGMIAQRGQPYEPDNDGDHAANDCDDTRNDIYPGAPDLEGDGVDQNCDGVDGWADPSAPPAAAVAVDPPDEDPAPPPPRPAAIAVDPPAP